MTLLSVVKDVCAVVGVTVPTSVMTGLAANRTMQEMLALANEMAQRIACDTRDWTLFRVMQIYPGAEYVDPIDGLTKLQTAFNLPANYRRLLLSGNVWRSTSTQTPMRFIPNTDEWMHRRVVKASDNASWGEWTILGGQMHIYPAMSLGASAYFAYIEKNCIALNSGGYGDSFLDDNDSFRLNERLLKLGMIWQWKQNKGTSYAEDMGTYTDALAQEAGHDSPAPILLGRRPLSDSARVAIPSQTLYFPGATP